jgi:hypothetical protein
MFKKVDIHVEKIHVGTAALGCPAAKRRQNPAHSTLKSRLETALKGRGFSRAVKRQLSPALAAEVDPHAGRTIVGTKAKQFWISEWRNDSHF